MRQKNTNKDSDNLLYILPMFRLLWHVLPDNQVVRTALTKVYGVGLAVSKKLCEQFSIPLNTRVKDITEEQQKLITDTLRDMLLESDLKREVAGHIKRLKEIRCYRGMRHLMWLPVRGQLTGQNWHTAKKLLWRAKVRPTLKK